MTKRRGSSKNFNIGAVKSPYVLDLSDNEQKTERKKRKNRTKKFSNKKPREINAPAEDRAQSAWEQGLKVSKENLLEELEHIESYDTELAIALSAEQNYAEEAFLPDPAALKYYQLGSFEKREQVEELFSPKQKKPQKTKPHNLKGFISASILLTVLVSGVFFVQKSSLFSTAKMLLGQSGSAPAAVLEPTRAFSSNNFLSLAASVGFSAQDGPASGWDFGGIGKNFSSLLGVVDIAKDFYSIAPVLLGETEPKKYMIIFQNSSELRPTGGFIGSYAAVDISGGEITDIKVNGIYNLDGQLTVNIVPPEPFYHITSAWSTHDANWFLDFPESAKKIMWFYKMAGEGELDGIIAFNVEVIEKLLELTGPIALPEYDLVLDSVNFRDEIQYEVEVGYDKNLNRPKKVIADLFPVLMEKLSSDLQYSESQKKFVSLILESLEKRNIMFYSSDEKVQEFFVEHGWGGDIKCKIPDAKCSNYDYLAVAHSNLGGYKTDKYTDNSVDYFIEIEDDGDVIANVTVEREHNGGDLNYWWYNRQNIDYIKLYVPLGSQILSYSGGQRREFDNAPDYNSPNFQRDPQIALSESEASRFGSIDIFKESGKTVFGTWLITNPKSSSSVTVSYRLPFRVEFGEEFAKYNLYIQKQPGAESDVSFDISYPKSWEIFWSKAQSEFLLDKDEVVGYIFSK